MNYSDALKYIHSREKFGSVLGLSNMEKLLNNLGNPQKNLKFIHVAGTNGKGSTSTFISNILCAKGFKTGLYISPFVNTFNERIQINNTNIPDDELAYHTEIVKNAIDDSFTPTEFEIVTAVGLSYFAKQKCDYVCLEVGLGGRFDATNIIPPPLVCVIASISIDHTNILGDTLEKIAFEKAGIIKRGSTLVSYCDNPIEANNVINETAISENVPHIIPDINNLKIISEGINGTSFVYKNNEYFIRLLGKHQVFNALSAIEVSKLLKIDDNTINNGLSNTLFKGRLEIISNDPLTIIDGAHNYSGVINLKDALNKYFPNKKITLIMGMLKDKEYEKCIAKIAPVATNFIAVEPDNPRKLKAVDLYNTAKKYNKNVTFFDDKYEAIKKGIELNNDLICICGSLYLIGNIKIEK